MEEKYKLTPKGILLNALMESNILTFDNDTLLELVWTKFELGLLRSNYKIIDIDMTETSEQ